MRHDLTAPMRVYRRLLAAFGPQHWWPADAVGFYDRSDQRLPSATTLTQRALRGTSCPDSPFEVMVGAILTQNTNWRNVEKAISNLKDARLLSARSLGSVRLDRLARLIRPAGYFNVKAARLKHFVRWFNRAYDGSTKKMFSHPPDRLRDELLAVKGIGPETADSMLLYAGKAPVFVVDAYTRRILSRHGLVAPNATYADVKRFFESNLPLDEKLFNEYHALLVRLGKEYCRTKPLCATCPVRETLGMMPD